MTRGTALITGASSGIGEAFAKLLAREKFDLVLTARREDRLQGLQESLGEADVAIVPADLSTQEGIQRICQYIDDNQIDVLVNNAGMMLPKEFIEHEPEELDQLIAVNISALTQLTHHAVRQMRNRKSGRVLNVASVAAFHPVPGLDVYAATKAYVLSLTESLSEELRGTGISVTALCPGLTDTEMVDDQMARTIPPFLMASAESVAREGYQALMAREVIRVPGGANRLALLWAQHQPRWLVRGLGGLAARFGSLTSNNR